MTRLVTAIAVLMLVLWVGPGRAQTAATPSAAAPAAKPAVTVSAADLRKLVGILQNPQERAALIEQLEALTAAEAALTTPGKPGAASAAAATAKPAAAKPNTTVAAVQKTMPVLVEGLAARFQSIGGELAEIAGIARGAPRLIAWVQAQAASPDNRAAWLDGAARLFAAFAAAIAAGFLTALALRRFRRRLAARYADPDFGRWLVLFIGMLVLELIPLGVFAAMATVVLAAVRPDLPARTVAATAIATIARAQLILIALRVFLVSDVAPHFLRRGIGTRRHLYVWARRFVVWSFYGYGVATIAAELGAPRAIADLVLRVTVIVVAGLAIAFVLRNRVAIGDALRVPPDRPGRFGRTSQSVRLVRNALADTWHILAILYIVGSVGAFLVDPAAGFSFVLRATLVSILVLLGAFAATRLVHRFDGHGLAFGAGFSERHPVLEQRLSKYAPALIFLVSIVIDAAAIVLLLQVWGVGAVNWLEHQYVRSLTGTLISIGIVVVLAIVVWEMVDASVGRALTGRDPAQQAQVSARLRTLLPLIRTTVLIAIVTIAGFVVLSQIGVNIAPLLAGAGIVGIAVGFGSQQLVHDIINGLFILIENTVTVGDWVDVGSGHAGSVETISIRSMRLRDGNGAVHTVPYSSVAAITNTNRGIGNATFAVAVAYGEDTDKVARILTDIAAGMRREPAFKTGMLSEFQLWGVDKVDAATATVSGQIVCTDAGRWPVQREFNRRMMLRFQAENIALAMPLQGVVMREPPSASGVAAPVTPLRAPRDRG